MNDDIYSMQRIHTLLYLLLWVMMLPSCRSWQSAAPMHSGQDSTCHRSMAYNHDSIHIHDSVVITLSPLDYRPSALDYSPSTDTQRVEHWRTEWRDRVVHHTDTLVRIRADTVYMPIRQQAAQIVPKFYKRCTLVLLILVLTALLYAGWRVVKRLYLH